MAGSVCRLPSWLPEVPSSPSLLWSREVGAAGGGAEKGSPWCLHVTPREEKTEQLGDTRHEVDQLVLELQKVKQEVSGRGFAHVWGVEDCAHVWGGSPRTVAWRFGNAAAGTSSKGLCFCLAQSSRA